MAHDKFVIVDHDKTERHALGSVVPHDALGSLTEKAHASLTDVGPSDHHAKYTDDEAEAAVKAAVEVADLKTPTKALPMNSQKVTGIADATEATDAMSLGQKYTDDEAQATVKASVEVAELKAPTQALPMNSQKITGLAAPVDDNDAARKVDIGTQPTSKIQSGLDSAKPTTPAVGDIYFSTDTGFLWCCKEAESWVGVELTA